MGGEVIETVPPQPELVAAPVPVAPSPAALWIRRIFTFPVNVFLFTRIAWVGTSLMGMELVPNLYLHDDDRFRFFQPYGWIDAFCRWDCGWFRRIVEHGYPIVENAKVFPLLPLIGWSVEKVTGLHHVIVFIIVANVCSLASYFVIYRLFEEASDTDSARWGLIAFAAYPFAFFQACAYPESMMILATAGSLLLAKRGKHLWAGLVLGLGVMARHLTLSGGTALIAAHIRQRGIHPKKLLLNWGILGLLIPWAFLGAFSYYLWWTTGDALAFWNSRTIGWNDWVWYGARQVVMNIPYHERPEYYFYIVIAMIPAVGAGLLLRKKQWAELAAHGVTLMVIVLSSGAAGMGRYSASCWPAFLPIGIWLAKRPVLQGPAIALLAIVQGFFWFLYSHQFRIL